MADEQRTLSGMPAAGPDDKAFLEAYETFKQSYEPLCRPEIVSQIPSYETLQTLQDRYLLVQDNKNKLFKLFYVPKKLPPPPDYSLFLYELDKQESFFSLSEAFLEKLLGKEEVLKKLLEKLIEKLKKFDIQGKIRCPAIIKYGDRFYLYYTEKKEKKLVLLDSDRNPPDDFKSSFKSGLTIKFSPEHSPAFYQHVCETYLDVENKFIEQGILQKINLSRIVGLERLLEACKEQGSLSDQASEAITRLLMAYRYYGSANSRLDTATRIAEDGTLLSSGLATAFSPLAIDDPMALVYDQQQFFTPVGSLLSFIAAGIWLYFKDKQTIDPKGPNPWYRCFKTLYVFGDGVGKGISFFAFSSLSPAFAKLIGIALGAVLGVIFGVVGGTFDYLCGKQMREKLAQWEQWLSAHSDFYRYTVEKDISFFAFGTEGWSKYGKLGFVLFSMIGAAVFVACGGWLGLSAMAAAFYGTALFGAVGFLFLVLAVPLFNFCKARFGTKGKEDYENWLATQKVLPSENPDPDLASAPVNVPPAKEGILKYRTNYARTGMVIGGGLGYGLGALLGFLGIWVVGGISGGGTFAVAGTAVVLAAIGAVVFALVFHFAGPYLTRKCDPYDLLQNSFDYTERSVDFAFKNGLGYFLLFMLNMQEARLSKEGDGRDFSLGLASTVAGICTAVWLFAYYKFHPIPKTQAELQKAYQDLLPLSQSSVSILILGMAIGGLIGAFFPPFGFMIGTAVGAVVGGVVGVTCGEKICEMISGAKKKILDKILKEGLEKSEQLIGPQNTQKVSTTPISSAASSLNIMQKLRKARDHLLPDPCPIETTAVSFSERIKNFLLGKQAMSEKVPDNSLTIMLNASSHDASEGENPLFVKNKEFFLN